jgi:vacuolar-type H+-ATPase subunit F/Vma7
LDWDVISAAIWHDTPDDNSRKRRKQAEMLIHSFFPLIGIDQIATKDEATASKVREILQNTDYDIKVVTKRKWYY